MTDRPTLQPAASRPNTARSTALAAVLVGVVGVVALLLLLVPPTTGPIYTDLPPVDQVEEGDLGGLLGLLPLSVAAVGLVLLGAFVIPILIRRLAAGQLDPAIALAAAGRLQGRLRLVRFLPALRVASVVAGGLLTALSVAITVPEIIGRLGSTAIPDPTIKPVPVDPSLPRGAIDPATLLAMVTGVVIFGGLLLLILPSLKIRLRLPARRRPGPVRPAVTDQSPSPFVANPELPPEIAALFRAPPRQPTRLDRFYKYAAPRLRALTAVLVAFLRATAAAMGRGAIATGRALVRGGRVLRRAPLSLIRRAAIAIVNGSIGTARLTIRVVYAASRLTVAGIRLITHWTVATARTMGRLLVRLVEQIGAGIILGLFVLLLVLLTLVDLALRILNAGVRLAAWALVWLGHAALAGARAAGRASLLLVRAVIRTGGRVLHGMARLLVAGGRLTVRVVRAIERWATSRTDDLLERLERLIDARRRPAEGGPMTTPATVLVVALAPQSGKSTVAAEAARLLGTTWINSSAVIAERLEQRLGLPAGRIAETRKVDHEAYRPALIEEGNRMTAEGTSPGVECVRRGYRVIDGIRRRDELEAAIAEVRARGGVPVVICVRRPNAPALADNTESAALAALADVTIDNDGALSRLRRRTSAALRRYRDR